MNWTQVDIYTSTIGIDLLCSNLMDLGIRGFSIQDAEDFNEFCKIRMASGIILTRI